MIIIQLTEKQVKLLEPLRVLAQDSLDKNELGIVLAQIALDDHSHRSTNSKNAMRGEMNVAFVENVVARRLIKVMNCKLPLDKTE